MTSFYAAHNTRADINQGNQGFGNTWEVSRFASRKDRDAFVDRMENQNAKPVTRKEAEDLWRSTYLMVGETPPRGGLFQTDQHGVSRFWNELSADTWA